ncbi:hypothetical protein OKW96_15985 [Sphingobacterium sp. KU25419]|nr:hypothetical protein OKW96_15985 [Sphingobacterium sp. KU25419]
MNYTFDSQTAPNVISSTQTGLTVNTLYYWKVYALTEGALSSGLSGSQSTFCLGAPSLSATITETCIGGSTGTIGALVTGSTAPYTYSLDAGVYQSSPTFTGLAAGAHTLNVKSTSACIVSITVPVNPYPNSTDNQNEAGTDFWVGHMYDGINFAAYVGHFIETETFSESFGGSNTCFNISSNSLIRSIFTEAFSVKFKMISTRRGLYTLNLGSDDGGRLTVDGVLLYNNWNYQSFANKPNVLLSLNGGSSLLYEYFEGSGDNQVVFQTLGLILANTLSANTAQTICGSSTGSVIGGDSFGALPAGLTLSGTGYQWSYSTTPNGARTNIPGATGTTFTPSTLAAPFNTTGTYYIYRNAALSSINNISPNPYIATNESNAAVVTINAAGQWIGSTSNNWADGSNWCSGIVPTATTDVVITSTATVMPNITSSVSCRNLTLNAGSTLTLGSAGTLNIAGTLANSGTLMNTGTVNFNGTSGQQTFSGVSTFFNVTLNNSAGLLLPAAITIASNLTISAGTLVANNFNIAIAGNWTNNVSTTAFTAGTATTTFNGTTSQAIGGTFATAFNNFTVAGTANTITLNTNASIGGNLSVSSGIFDLSTFTANRATAGGTLTVSNNATLKIGGTNTYPTNYTANTLVVASTVEYSGTNQTVTNQLYGNLTLSSSSGASVKTFPATALTLLGNLNSNLGAGTSVLYAAASNITVNGNVSIGPSTTFNGSSFSHNIGSNWVNNGIFNGNTGSVTFTGPGSTVSGSGTQNFNNLTIAASLISFSANSISLTGNLATTGSGSFSQLSGGTILMTGTGKTISGFGISPHNLTIIGTISTTDALVIAGNLSVSGSFTTSTGAMTMSGTSKTISGTGTMSFGVLSITGTIAATANFTISSSLSVNGTFSATAGTATFTGTATLGGTANLFNTTINGTSLQLSASSTLGIASALTITSGILDVSSSAPNTVNFNGSGAQNINAITYNNLSLSNGNNKTAIAALTMNNSLTIGTGTTFIPGAFTHSIYSNWNNSGTFNAGTSTVQFLGNQASTITGVTAFNILTINNTTAATGATLQSNVSATTVNMMMGTLLTGTNTLTITGTRTANGIILGNIQRNHVFTTGVAYAFEGPNNLVTFTGPSGVNSVTISVALGPLSDFPFGGSISRLYTVTIPSGTYTSATLRLHYEDAELNGSNEATMGLWRYNGTSWTASGKTANDATANYVEKSLLLDVTNRWTLSDNSNVVQWNGSVSTDWNTAANWTTVQGSASTPPSATDIVNLGTVAFTNQPTISSTVNVKNINFGSAQAVSLSMASGGSLISGDIYGTWSGNVTHAFNVNNQSVTVNGNLSLSDGTSGHAINLNIGTGTVTLGGSLNQSGGANVLFIGAGKLNILMNHNYVNGTFSPGTGTVTYSGVTTQVIGAVNYNNLIINKSAAAAEIANTLIIGGNLTVTAGELDNFSTTTILGDVTISSGAILHNSSILQIGGNWANSGTYDDAGTKIIFDGSGTQTITASTFNNLEINKPVGSVAVLTGDVTLKGNLTGTSGTLDIKSFFFNRTVVGGTAIIANAGTLIIAADNAPNKFANYALGATSTVIFNGTGTQHLLLPGVTYGNLIFRNTGLKILYTPITVNGDLTIETGGTFDGGANTITLNGNWMNIGTFTPSTSTVLCAGTSKNISGNTTFNKMTVIGSYTILNDVTFNSLLNITNTGSLSGGSTITTTINADLTNSGTLYTLGTCVFTGNVLQTLSLINAVTTVAITVNFNGTVSPVLNSTSVPQFGFLNINNTGGVNASVGWTILYGLALGNGASFNGGNATHNIMGSLTNNGTITSSGTLNFIPTSTTTLNLGTAFSSTGTVVFGGAGAITLAGSPTSFRNIVISNTNPTGLSPSSALTITNNFSINGGAILNASSYTHSVAGNISNNGTLNGNTSTFTLNGTSAQVVNSASPFNNLTVNNTAGAVILSSNVAVNGILNFVAGKIQTGSNVLTQSSTGSVTGAAQNTGWINGKLKKNVVLGVTTKIFEIGDGTSYTPLSLTFAGITTNGDLTASTTNGDHPSISSSTINPTKSVNRFWTLTNSGIVLSSYEVTFNFLATDIDAGAITSGFIVGNYNTGSWTYPTIGTLSSSSTEATGLPVFGDFQIGDMNVYTKTWTGGAGTNNWGDAMNWNSVGVPSATDNVELTGETLSILT